MEPLEHPQERSNLRDIILGGQDGVVNVLGVTLGVAVASGDTRLILAAGLAATFAESISMAAVAYTSTLAERDYYRALLAMEESEIVAQPKEEEEEMRRIYQKLGFSKVFVEKIIAELKKSPKGWVEEMMAHELKIAPKALRGVFITSAVVGISAIVGSFIPLVPFLFLTPASAMWISLAVSALALFLAGVYKAKVTTGSIIKSGLEIAVIGTVSALAGYFIGLLFRAPV